MEQYKKLQHTWKGSGLPIDLFYKKGQEHIVTKKQSILSKALNIFGFISKSSKSTLLSSGKLKYLEKQGIINRNNLLPIIVSFGLCKKLE